MPLPYRSGAVRATPEWSFFELHDPSFEPVAGENGEERMGSVWVAFRALFDIEVDKIERSPEYLEFVQKHFLGGFEIDTKEGKETVKDPMPLIVDGRQTEIDEDHVLFMFRAFAMQKPAIGQAPPVHPDGHPITLVTIRDMVDAAAGRADLFWKGLQATMTKVWDEGQQGKGFRRTGPTSAERPAG